MLDMIMSDILLAGHRGCTERGQPCPRVFWHQLQFARTSRPRSAPGPVVFGYGLPTSPVSRL